MKKLIIISMILLLICSLTVACSYTQEGTSISDPTGEDYTESGQSSEETDYTMYSEAFMSACADTGIDISQVKEWEQIDDWTNGERFRFSYERHSFTVYVN